LPTYNSTISSATYSVAYMGTYTGDSEGSGSHPGVDIRVPVGTPIVSIANGIVDQIKRGGGFGNVIIVRHPGVPDPDDPKSLTTLYSSYAHLDSIGVTVGMIVGKGEQIGTSGQTGFVSGPHLHFQIDTEDAPWHPYWPFTTEQQAAAGYTTAEAVNAGLNRSNGYMYTINPMKYVQANYDAVDQVIVVEEEADPVDRMLSSVDERRLARMKSSGQTVAYHSQSSSSASSEPVTVSSSSVSSIVPKLSPTLNIKSATEERMIARMKRERFVVRRENVASPIVYSEEVVSIDLSSGFNPTKVHSLRIRHDGSFAGRGWEKVVIELLDIEGNTIRNPILEDDLYMRTAYGEAEFRPSIVSQIDFENGEATIHMLPRGRRTVVIQARPFIEQSKPMVWENK